MDGKTGLLLGVMASVLLLSVALAAFTVTLYKPATNAYVRGIYVLQARTVGNATNVTFDYSTTGFFAGEQVFIGSNFSGSNLSTTYFFNFSWNTVGLDLSSILIRVRAFNGSLWATPDINSGITVDNTMPVVSNIQNETMHEYTTTITWTTDENTNSTVEYGTTAALGKNTSGSNYVKSHSVSITGLLESQLYYYNVTSCDHSGNCLTNGTYNFTTINKQPIIAGVTASSVWNESALISWNIHESANASVEYGITTALGTAPANATNATMSTSHSINLTGLINGTKYYYNVTSCDNSTNCKTSGPKDFTTMADTALPRIPNPLINGKTSATVKLNDYINITADVSDNTGVSSVWAKLDFHDGTSRNEAMSLVAGTQYRVTYRCIKSGIHNVTIYAKDGYDNMGTSMKLNLSVYGYFTILTTISSPFRNFTYDGTDVFYTTVINDNNITENYTITVSLTNKTGTNITGWSVAANQSNVTDIAPTVESGEVNITVVVPEYPVANVWITLEVNSSKSNVSKTKRIEYRRPTISIKVPTAIKVSNNSNMTEVMYYYVNESTVTTKLWTKYINVTGLTYFNSEADGNVTSTATVRCGLHTGKLKKATKAGTFTASKGTCKINCGTIASRLYNFTINATSTRGHRGNATFEVFVPASVTVDVDDVAALKNMNFYVTGTAKYATGYPVYHNETEINVNISYGFSICTGTTKHDGTFSILCPITSVGTYALSTKVKGIWNMSKTGNATLTVSERAESGAKDVVLVTSANLINLTENKTITLTILNNYSSQKTFTIVASETGSLKHFDLNYTENITIAAKTTGSMNIKLIPFKYGKPGTYTLKISIPAESEEKSVTVKIPEFNLVDNQVNINRYVENNQDDSQSTVVISIVNKKALSVEMNITENISKNISNSTDDLDFDPEPTRIIQSDPVVLWTVSVEPDETKTLSYTVNKSVIFETFAEPIKKIVKTFVAGGEQVEPTEPEGEDMRIYYIIIILIATSIMIFFVLFRDKETISKLRGKIPSKLVPSKLKGKLFKPKSFKPAEKKLAELSEVGPPEISEKKRFKAFKPTEEEPFMKSLKRGPPKKETIWGGIEYPKSKRADVFGTPPETEPKTKPKAEEEKEGEKQKPKKKPESEQTE